MYNRLRNTIESLNGTLKDGPIRDAQRRRGRGKAIQTILSAVFVFAANVEKLITWLHDTFRGKKYLDVPTRRPRAPRKRVLIGRVDRRTRRRHDRHLTLT